MQNKVGKWKKASSVCKINWCQNQAFQLKQEISKLNILFWIMWIQGVDLSCAFPRFNWLFCRLIVANTSLRMPEQLVIKQKDFPLKSEQISPGSLFPNTTTYKWLHLNVKPSSVLGQKMLEWLISWGIFWQVTIQRKLWILLEVLRIMLMFICFNVQRSTRWFY